MSFPFRGQAPDTDSTPLRSAGYECPRCRRRFADWIARCPTDGSPLLAAEPLERDSDPMVGRDLDNRYTILARLGSGSMGTVYRARQNAMMREVAIKILRSDKALDETSKARFLRESRATSALTSPNTVTVFDFGETSSRELFLAMELLDGESLGQRLTRVGRMPPLDAVDTARQVLRSLAEAHAKGIVHRDLKPDNIFFARVAHVDHHEEIVKVLDFGIAKLLGEAAGPLNAVETQAGTVFGTPRYMSPEQAQSKPLDGRTDLYSLGVLLYHMLTGNPPFTDDDAIIVMARHIRTPPRAFAEVAPDAAIPIDLERVVMRCLTKDPNDRPTTADVLSLELSRAVDPARAIASGVRPTVGSSANVLAQPDVLLGHDPIAFRPSLSSAGVTQGTAVVVAPPPRWPLVVLGCAILLALSAIGVLLRARSMHDPAGAPALATAGTPAGTPPPGSLAATSGPGTAKATGGANTSTTSGAAPGTATASAAAATPDDALEPTSLPLATPAAGARGGKIAPRAQPPATRGRVLDRSAAPGAAAARLAAPGATGAQAAGVANPVDAPSVAPAVPAPAAPANSAGGYGILE